jgi:hypothetical protein
MVYMIPRASSNLQSSLRLAVASCFRVATGNDGVHFQTSRDDGQMPGRPTISKISAKFLAEIFVPDKL